MAGGWLATVSDAARLAWSSIASGVRQGLSGRAIGRAVRLAGLSVSNESLYAIIDREKEIWRHGQSLKFLNMSARPSVAGLPEAMGTLTRKYSFTVELRGTIRDTAKQATRFVTISTDRLLTRGQIEDVAADYARSSRDVYNMDTESVMLTGGVKAGAYGIL